MDSNIKQLLVSPQPGLASNKVAERVALFDEQGNPIDLSFTDRYASELRAALKPWYAALAKRATTRANAVVIGGGLTEAFSPSAFDRTFPRRLQASLRNVLPTPGITGPGGRGFIGVAPSSEVTSFSPWPATLQNAPTIDETTYGPNAVSASLPITGSKSVTYSLYGTHADVLYTGSSATGTLNFVVDGTAATTQITGPNPLSGGRISRVSLGASGFHTLVISATGAPCILEGVVEYDGDETAGIMVHGCGFDGATAASWATKFASFTGQSIAALNPHILIFELGSNDMSIAEASPAAFAMSLETAVEGFVDRVENINGYRPPSIILPIYRPNTAYQTSWPAFVDAMKSVAEAKPTERICLDMSSRMPDVSFGLAGLYADVRFSSDGGHQMIADALASVLVPS